MKIVLVGGVAGGATAAARLRRLDEQAQIVVFERGAHVSFANCGLPYHVGGVIEERETLLLQSPSSLRARYALDVRTRHEVLAIRPAEKVVTVRDLERDVVFDERYDALVLSPGARPIVPDVPGADDPRVRVLRTLEDADRIVEIASSRRASARRAVVVGGGFVGVEMAENLRHRGMAVTMIEAADQILGFLDPDVASFAARALEGRGVRLLVSAKVVAFRDEQGFEVVLEDGRTVPADLVVVAIGVRPEVGLARDAGLAIGPRGGIVVDARMKTSDPAIWAVGDAVEIPHGVCGGAMPIPLAGPANRQARVAADAILGRPAWYDGTYATSIVRACDVTCAAVGASSRALRAAGVAFRTATVHASDHASWFPGAEALHLKLLYADDGRLLGAQACGASGVDKRIDVLAAALRHGATVHDLVTYDLAYAPQFGSAKDPIHLAGMVAENDLRGVAPLVDAGDVAGEALLLDVRTDAERACGAIEGSIHVPIDELRARLGELPRDREIVTYCAVGRRGYVAQRILLQAGLRARNLSGGYTSWCAARGRAS